MSRELHALIEEENFSEALKLIDSNNNLSLDMVQAKIFCLINLEKISLALSTIKIFEKRLNLNPETFAFEKSYCCYRLGKLAAARKILENGPQSPRMTLLLAQVLYKSGDYEEALKTFESLYFENLFDREQLEINILACKSHLGKDHVSLKNYSFDSVYNLAMTKLSCKEIKTAQEMAEKCIEMLGSDSGSDKDRVNVELISICAAMKESHENWPESNFLLRKLKSSRQLSAIQTAIVDANIIISSSEPKKLVNDFQLSDLNKINLSEEQKCQILCNYHKFGAAIPKSELSKLSISPEIKYGMKLKSESKVIKKSNSKQLSKPLDKERWLPLRDRSYYLPKEKYLKQLKKTSIKKA